MIPGLLGRPAAGLAGTLLLDEEFVGTTQAYYEGRGWYDGTSGITDVAGVNGYKFVTDATLGRNVMYGHCVNAGTTGLGPGFAWRYSLDTVQTATGATFYTLFKVHNVLGAPVSCHWLRFARGFGQFTGTNSNGQMDWDICDLNSDSPVADTADNGATILTNSNPFPRSIMYASGQDPKWSHTSNLLTEDTWYEAACYVKPSTGNATNDGILQANVRLFGATPWTSVMSGVNLPTAFLGPIPSIIPVNYFMIAPFWSSSVWTNDVRWYFGSIKLYGGNALPGL